MEYLKLEDFRDYCFLSQLKFSPDGSKIALAVKKSNDKNGYFTAIYVNQGDGFYSLTSEKGNVSIYAWLDNENILFSDIRDSDAKEKLESGLELTCFYKINVNGGEAKEEFIIDAIVSQIQPLPDGKYLIAATFDNNRPNLTGKTPEQTQQLLKDIKKEKEYQIVDELPFWSNGMGFTNKKRKRLYTYCTSNGLKPLTGPLASIEEYKLSPNGKYIAFSENGEQGGVREIKERLFLVDIEKEDTIPLIRNPVFMKCFDFYEDKLVYNASEGEKYNMHQHGAFYSMDLQTKEIQKLTEFDRSVGSTVGSDCKLGGGHMTKVWEDSYYFISLDGYCSDIFRLCLHTGKIEKVTDGKGSVDFFDVCDKGVQAVGLFNGRLQETYAVEEGRLSPISRFNEVIHETKKYVKPQHYVLKDKEGCEFDGWAILPVDYDPAKKYPAILDVHGGPKSAYGDVYFHEMQYWANQNYFVLFANPRGSDGKGNDFAEIRGRYGTIDYDNLMQFVDEMIAQYPAIDIGKLGITGGSYGGYMTNWVIGHTDRFAAAASQRGISNWIGFNCISDIGYYFGNDQMQADAWSDVDKLWWHSPLKYADKAKTPTLFIHSDEDYRCWIPEAYQMFTALKLHGIETRLCIFHGENHELSRSGKPDHRARRIKEITDWMDKYLK